jgi:CheY-like chemotaxis protein
MSIPKDFPIFFLVDQNRLKQCLLNIVGNALKYTEKGTISLIVEIKEKKFNRPQTKNNKDAIFIDGLTYYNIGTVDLEIKVQDTGIGIKKENISSLFNPFGQAVPHAHHTKKSGLGLSIAKGLIDIMKGKIIVDSTFGKGSLFSLKLNDLEIFEQENNENDTFDETIDITNVVFKESTILFIEDFPLDRLLFEKYMEHLGFHLIEVSNAKDALEKLKTLTPDLIITDILLPEMNGLDFAKKVKSSKKTKHIPIFAISSLYSDNNMEPDCQKEISKEEILNVFDELLTKPLTINNLIYKLSQFLPFESSKEKTVKLLKEKEKVSLTDKETLFLFLDEVLKNKYPLICGSESTINDLEDFGRLIVNKAKKHNCKRLEKWATGLTLATLEFNMADVKRILEVFPNEIDTIKKL